MTDLERTMPEKDAGQTALDAGSDLMTPEDFREIAEEHKMAQIREALALEKKKAGNVGIFLRW